MRATIRLKLVSSLAVGLAIIAGATAVLMKFVHQRAISAAAEQQVAAAATALDDLDAAEIARMSGLLDVLLTDDRLAERFVARDRQGLLALAQPRFEALKRSEGLTHWYFHPPTPAVDGVFLRVHRPALHGDPVRRALVTRALQTGAETSGIELGRTAYAVRVVRPWLRDGKLIGLVELGQDIPTFLARMRGMTRDHYGMVLAKERLDRAAWAAISPRDRWEDRPGLLVVETTTGDERLLQGLERLPDVPDRPRLLGQETRGERIVARGVFPLRDGTGTKIGGVAVEHEVTTLYAGVRDVRGRVIALVALLATALSALIVFLLDSMVLDRLERMTQLLERLPDRLARGEYDVEELGPPRDDEVGRFEAFFARALREVGSFVADERRDRTARAGRRGDGGA